MKSESVLKGGIVETLVEELLKQSGNIEIPQPPFLPAPPEWFGFCHAAGVASVRILFKKDSPRYPDKSGTMGQTHFVQYNCDHVERGSALGRPKFIYYELRNTVLEPFFF